MTAIKRAFHSTLALGVILGLAGCDTDFSGIDFDLRGNTAGALDTAGAARAATEARPAPDANGLITYPNYQVVVARQGDSVRSIAERIGMSPEELARFNGRTPDETLRRDEILALPRIISGAPSDARPDIGAIAGAAIDRAGTDAPTPSTPAVQGGAEPIRHRVARGETAFSIARLYGVSPRAMAEWNGLSPDLAVREGQHLIIPLVIRAETAATAPDTAAPGAGTATPVPPSATSALPEPITAAPLPASPDLDASRVETTPAAPAPSAPTTSTQDPPALRRPVDGTVLRAYSRRSEGIDFAAPAGTPVRAAAAGEVAAITRSTDQVPILVLRHDDNLLSVYANIADLSVDKGDRVRAGQTLAKVGPGEPPFLHFELRRGFEAIDPTPFLE